MAITNYFVAPGGTDDEVGDRGTVVGNPYATGEFALQTGIYNKGQGANGDRLIFAAGNYVLTANLGGLQYFTSFATATNKPFHFVGAGSSNTTLDGDGTYSVYANTTDDYIGFRDLELTNSGANYIIQSDNGLFVLRCKLHGTSIGWIDCDFDCRIFGNEFYNSSGSNGITTAADSAVVGNYIHDTTNGPSSRIISLTGAGDCVVRNIVRLSSQSFVTVIYSASGDQTVNNNSIWSVAGASGRGIYLNSWNPECIGNLIEGFSGAGGDGIQVSTAFNHRSMLANNAVYNCLVPYAGDITESEGWLYVNDNETLGASPFANAAGGDFTPVDVGNVWGGGWPTVGGSQPDKGAVQRLAGGGNGGDIYPYPRPRIFGIG